MLLFLIFMLGAIFGAVGILLVYRNYINNFMEITDIVVKNKGKMTESVIKQVKDIIMDVK